MSKSGGSASAISLPKGGGALHGLGEKFSPDLHTGTGNFSVPIAVPPGRNGFQPQLTLTYSTGNGNGPFGLGWSLSVPGVTRKTSKAIPRYQDGDTFLLSGAEDLVLIHEEQSGTQQQRLYRPRTEGLFARITHLQNSSDDYWEVRSKDGLTSWYGTPGAASSDSAVIADPADRIPVYDSPLPGTPRGGRAATRATSVVTSLVAAPYSLRPAPGAPVSTPIRWEELDDPGLRRARLPEEHRVQPPRWRVEQGRPVAVEVLAHEHHEAEPVLRSWAPTIDGLVWLARNGFALDVAGRRFTAETEHQLRDGYARLFAVLGVAVDAHDPVRLMLFPEMDPRRDVPELALAQQAALGRPGRPAARQCGGGQHRHGGRAGAGGPGLQGGVPGRRRQPPHRGLLARRRRRRTGAPPRRPGGRSRPGPRARTRGRRSGRGAGCRRRASRRAQPGS